VKEVMESRARPTAKAPGRLSRVLLGLLMKRATVVASEPLAARFRLITLGGSSLTGVSWTAGQKIQIAMGSAFVARTYTPIEWDPVAGRTRILGYAHGDGPGSAWVRGVKRGDECNIFGPRVSLDTRDISAPLAVFGDETSIGHTHALLHQDPTREMVCHFELDDIASGHVVAAHLRLDHAILHRRTESDGHIAEMDAALPALISAGASFILTGKSGTIQRLNQSLKRRGVNSGRIINRAYWTPGKTGLD
jgi:NADPH-dependent ferric siderophore reductase